MSFVKATVLQEQIPGFRVGQKALLKIRYLNSGNQVYHRYEGGTIWMGTVPKDIGRPGQRFNISADLLTTGEFVANLPSFIFRNDVRFTWLPEEVQILRITGGKTIRVVLQQQPAVEGISKFDVLLDSSETLRFGPGKGCYLEARLGDFFGHWRSVRIYHDGHSKPWIGFRQ